MSDGASVLGIFVGGASRRFGGVPKGMLPHPSEPGVLVERSIRLAREVGCEPWLVGNHPAYAGLGIRIIPDLIEGLGPIGGLAALIREAGDRNALVLGCDMPFVPAELLRTLMTSLGQEAAVVPCRGGMREPLCALYVPGRIAEPMARSLRTGRFGLQKLLRTVDVREVHLSLEQERWLRDWDAPDDVG